MRERFAQYQDDENILRDNLTQARTQLFLTANELVKQTNVALDQSSIIKSMNDQMQTLDESLKTAFNDIRKLHVSLEAAKRIDEYEPYVPRKNDEIDMRLSEIMNRTKMPIKFIRIGEGIYIFGSRRVHVKILNGKLVIRTGGGYMMLEEFIRLYAHQELMKLKTTRGDQLQYTDMDYEELPAEVRMNQVVSEENLRDQPYLIKELEQNRDNEIRIIPKQSPNRSRTEKSPSSYQDTLRSSMQLQKIEEPSYEDEEVR